MENTVTTPTTPPLPILASYWNAPCSYERNRPKFASGIADSGYWSFIDYGAGDWRSENGTINGQLLAEVETGHIRNVQLQLRSLDSLTDAEKQELFYIIFNRENLDDTPIYKGSNVEVEEVELYGYNADKSYRYDVKFTKTGLIAVTGTYMRECNFFSPYWDWGKALAFLRSIHCDIDGLGVARKEQGRVGE